jgi:hypothetical protein
MAFSAIGAMDYVKSVDEERKRRDDLSLAREQSLVNMYINKLEKQTAGKTGEKATSAAQAAMKLQDRVDKADLSDEDKAFFENLLEDPFASKEVLDLIEENVTNTGAPIPLSDVRSLISIVGSNIPTKDKVDYISLITGSDMSDDEKYYDLIKQISGIVTTPGRSVIIDINPEAKIVPKTQQELFERQLDIVNGNLLRNAKQFVKTENYDQENPQVRKIQNAIDMIESNNKDSISVGREILMDEYLTPENFKQNYLNIHPETFRGWEKNYFLPRSLQAVPDVNTGRVLTAEDIAASPTLQNLGAEPGDKIINIDGVDVLHDSNGNPKQ